MTGLDLILMPRSGRRAVVLADGEPPPPRLLAAHLAIADLFLCADAAGRPYDRLPRLPDAVVGDLDTLGGEVRDVPAGVRVVRDAQQDTTDAEKALDFAAQAGCREAVLLGGGGGLLDHALHNALLPERWAGRLRLQLADALTAAVRAGAGESFTWDLPDGAAISLLPLPGGARGVTCDGVRFPLRDAAVDGRGPATVSNTVAGGPVRLSVAGGSLLVVVRRGGAAP
ncbi:MAG: thiamine diphosphokinase [Candidatus Latescibacteria bacterium]|nr:thiamine diphosphokinase [Candidatus Latescibacterota bacterium]